MTPSGNTTNKKGNLCPHKKKIKKKPPPHRKTSDHKTNKKKRKRGIRNRAAEKLNSI